MIVAGTRELCRTHTNTGSWWYQLVALEKRCRRCLTCTCFPPGPDTDKRFFWPFAASPPKARRQVSWLFPRSKARRRITTVVMVVMAMMVMVVMIRGRTTRRAVMTAVVVVAAATAEKDSARCAPARPSSSRDPPPKASPATEKSLSSGTTLDGKIRRNSPCVSFAHTGVECTTILFKLCATFSGTRVTWPSPSSTYSTRLRTRPFVPPICQSFHVNPLCSFFCE